MAHKNTKNKFSHDICVIFNISLRRYMEKIKIIEGEFTPELVKISCQNLLRFYNNNGLYTHKTNTTKIIFVELA